MPRTTTKIVWSDHAKERMRARGIRRARVITLVRRALEAGDLQPGWCGRLVHGRLKVAARCATAGTVVIITVMTKARGASEVDPDQLRPRPIRLKLRNLKAKWHDEEE